MVCFPNFKHRIVFCSTLCLPSLLVFYVCVINGCCVVSSLELGFSGLVLGFAIDWQLISHAFCRMCRCRNVGISCTWSWLVSEARMDHVIGYEIKCSLECWHEVSFWWMQWSELLSLHFVLMQIQLCAWFVVLLDSVYEGCAAQLL